jgi:hypothetical protein
MLHSKLKHASASQSEQGVFHTRNAQQDLAVSGRAFYPFFQCGERFCHRLLEEVLIKECQ